VCFLRQADLVRHKNTLHLASKHITGELHAIVKSLLGKATREDMILWLANALNGNKERAKMQEDIKVTYPALRQSTCCLGLSIGCDI
jgi:hypothetical protein